MFQGHEPFHANNSLMENTVCDGKPSLYRIHFQGTILATAIIKLGDQTSA
jgi:hypothetical protein